MGAVFRLSADFDVTGFDPTTQVVPRYRGNLICRNFRRAP